MLLCSPWPGILPKVFIYELKLINLHNIMHFYKWGKQVQKAHFYVIWPHNVTLVSGYNIVIQLLDTSCYAHYKCSSICHHATLYNIIGSILYAVVSIPVTYSFHNWKTASPASLHLFCPSPSQFQPKTVQSGVSTLPTPASSFF